MFSCFSLRTVLHQRNVNAGVTKCRKRTISHVKGSSCNVQLYKIEESSYLARAVFLMLLLCFLAAAISLGNHNQQTCLDLSFFMNSYLIVFVFLYLYLITWESPLSRGRTMTPRPKGLRLFLEENAFSRKPSHNCYFGIFIRCCTFVFQSSKKKHYREFFSCLKRAFSPIILM